jgi:hypothetical protein
LKDRLRDRLRELKTGTSNDDEVDGARPQADDVFQQLPTTDGHVVRNMLRRR